MSSVNSPTSTNNGSRQASERLQGVTQGVHQTIDRLAERVEPKVQRLQEELAGASEMIEERADQLREMSDEWAETLRCAVRDNPIAALGVALVAGMLVARLSR